MKHLVVGWDHLFGPWLVEQNGGSWFPGRGSTIGLFDDVAGIVGAALFEGTNEASILMHCAGIGGNWLTREFLWFSFYYPFVQLGLKKVISPVEDSNLSCRRFIEHLGFDLEATLLDASPKGNLLIYTLHRDKCRWHSINRRPSSLNHLPLNHRI